MTRWLSFFALFASCSTAFSQDNEVLSSFPRKGSYLFFGQPAFEDNSFMMEEAINQEKGIMQFISNFYFDNIRGGDFLYAFSHDIPLGSLRHQAGYTLTYHMLKAAPAGVNPNGFGDINVGYHYMLSGKKDWAMVVPGITIIIPTGSAADGHGLGGMGGQVSVAITKRLSRKLTSHMNMGYTFIANADGYTSTVNGSPVLAYEKDLHYTSMGVSLVWYPVRKTVLTAEFISNALSDIDADGSLRHQNLTTINPGFRFAIDYRNLQIVPGLSVPVTFTDGNFTRTGLFFYLSFETEYLPFTKQKHR